MIPSNWEMIPGSREMIPGKLFGIPGPASVNSQACLVHPEQSESQSRKVVLIYIKKIDHKYVLNLILNGFLIYFKYKAGPPF